MFVFKLFVWIGAGVGILQAIGDYMCRHADNPHNNIYGASVGFWLLVGLFLFATDIARMFRDKTPNRNGIDDDRPLGARRNIL